MSYIDDILNEVASKTPKYGFNVCLFDEYGDEKLIVLEHFDKRHEAEEYAEEFEGETIYIYGNEKANEAMVMDNTEDWSWQFEDDNVKHWWNNADRKSVEEITGFSYKPYEQLSNSEKQQVDKLYGNEVFRISVEVTGINRDWDKEEKRHIQMGYQLNDDDIDEETGFAKYPDEKYEYEDWQIGGESKVKGTEGIPSVPSPYGIQKMLDKIVEGTLNNIEKKEIVEKVEDDFSLTKLLDLVADKLASKVGKKLGVESKASEDYGDYHVFCHSCNKRLTRKGKGVSYAEATIIKDRHINPNEDENPTFKNHNVEIIAMDNANEYNNLWYSAQSAKLPHWQNDRFTSSDSVSTKVSKLFNIYGFDITEQDVKSGKYGLEERMPVELMAQILGDAVSTESLFMKHKCPQCHVEYNTNDEVIIHMLEEDHGTNFDQIEDSPHNENISNEDVHFPEHPCPDGQKYYMGECMSISDYNKAIEESADAEYEEWWEQKHGNEATEGGKGSGKVGHVPWMLGTEIEENCPNCMINTEKENGKCILCGT